MTPKDKNALRIATRIAVIGIIGTIVVALIQRDWSSNDQEGVIEEEKISEEETKACETQFVSMHGTVFYTDANSIITTGKVGIVDQGIECSIDIEGRFVLDKVKVDCPSPQKITFWYQKNNQQVFTSVNVEPFINTTNLVWELGTIIFPVNAEIPDKNQYSQASDKGEKKSR